VKTKKNDNIFDVDQLLHVPNLEDKFFNETNVPLVSQISSVPIVPLIPKNNNINFNLIDNSDKEYFRSLGLDMVGNAEQMKVFF